MWIPGAQLWKRSACLWYWSPERQTTDFSVSFGDYLHSGSILGIPVSFEMCVHMFKCHKMSLQSTQSSSMSLQRKKVKQHKRCSVDQTQYLRGCRVHTVCAGTVYLCGGEAHGIQECIVFIYYLQLEEERFHPEKGQKASWKSVTLTFNEFYMIISLGISHWLFQWGKKRSQQSIKC